VRPAGKPAGPRDVLLTAQGANAKPDTGSPTAERLPIDEVDPTWPPTLPNDWILGDIRGLFVDDRDHLWVIHMPLSLTPPGDRGGGQTAHRRLLRARCAGRSVTPGWK
jgi:hypothetical protein